LLTLSEPFPDEKLMIIIVLSVLFVVNIVFILDNCSYILENCSCITVESILF